MWGLVVLLVSKLAGYPTNVAWQESEFDKDTGILKSQRVLAEAVEITSSANEIHRDGILNMQQYQLSGMGLDSDSLLIFGNKVSIIIILSHLRTINNIFLWFFLFFFINHSCLCVLFVSRSIVSIVDGYLGRWHLARLRFYTILKTKVCEYFFTSSSAVHHMFYFFCFNFGSCWDLRGLNILWMIQTEREKTIFLSKFFLR